MEFAMAHMQGKGWSSGDGLGRNKQVIIMKKYLKYFLFQGITDAIKPKLKFDQTGVGHSK